MKEKKQKMSNKAFRILLIIPMTLFLVIGLALPVVGNMLSATLDTYVGAGEKSIQHVDESVDANYYEVNFSDSESAKEYAYAVAKKVAEEGSTLLKNNGILPLGKGSTVMPFGYAYLNPIYGQLSSGGSAKWVIDPITPEKGLAAFSIDNAAVEIMRNAETNILVEAEGTKPAGTADSVLGGDCKIYEYDASIFDGMEKAENATGMVFITRSGQEGQDQKYDAYEDGTPHYLALTANELKTIQAAKETCGSVVVILVSSAPMEVGKLMEGELEADAILWIGHPGERGFATLSDLLDGDVNPSGRTVDTWSYDFTKDPSYQSIGVNTYTNYKAKSDALMGGGEFDAKYNEYMEGVYMGYRYYETADELDDGFVYGELDGKGAFVTKGAVCYPFGYGLSYTTFEQKLEQVQEDGKDITATVKVTNTGKAKGREVVQLYYSAPYTELDITNKIEKPVVNLIAFAKTEELEPGASETVKLTFHWDDMASYSYMHVNDNGTIGCYMLEEGEYVLSLRRNSHETIEETILSRDETIWYDGSDADHIRNGETDAQSKLDKDGNVLDETADPNGDYIAATNLFQVMSDYMNKESTLLSRADWKSTQPKGEEDHAKEISEEFSSLLGLEYTFDVNTDPLYGNTEGSLVYAENKPASKAKNNLVLSQLRGLDYYDEAWDSLLDQIDWDKDAGNIKQNFSGDAYLTAPIKSIGLPATVAEDGANGLKVNGMTSDGSGYDMTKSSSFGFAPLMAATWNKNLLHEVGEAFGTEAIANGVNGWYCPAINLHRSFFSGRVFEYYSEDPVLSGVLAASVISGAGDQGMFCYVKHFALNETETGRASLIYTWADEQIFRELHLRAFEYAIKDARSSLRYYDASGTMTNKVFKSATAVMAAQNCVGTVVGECNYALLTSLLRKEWGFQGMVISDYWVWNNDNLRDLAVRAGCDTYLCISMPVMWSIGDYESATSRLAMRQAIKNIAYAVANSNAMQGYEPGAVQVISRSPWWNIIVGVDALLALLIAGGIYWIVKRTQDEKAHPESYKRKNRK